MHRAIRVALFGLGILTSVAVQADVLRWDDAQVIPGTEGIVPGPGVKLDSWNKQAHNLFFAEFSSADLTGAAISRSWLDNARFTNAKLVGANLSQSRFTDVDFSGADLTGANFDAARLMGANLANARISGAMLAGTASSGFTKEQLYSTKSYLEHNLTDIDFSRNNLTGWDFAGQNIAGADFSMATFSKEQLYSTASYLDRDLTGFSLNNVDLTGWSFAGQDLRDANLHGDYLNGANFSGSRLSNALFVSSTFTDADFSFADMRGALEINAKGISSLRNSIGRNGRIEGFALEAGETMVIRDDDGVPGPLPPGWRSARPPIAINVRDHFTMNDDSSLQMQFQADEWGSRISFLGGIPVALGGQLDLSFAPGVESNPQVGRTFAIFDWTGVAPTGQFTVPKSGDWDLSQLYSTGEVTLLAAGGAIAGDANGDGQVNLSDFGILKSHFGGSGTRADGDANGDGQIDLTDFGLLKRTFGRAAPLPAPVPEPSSALLAVVGLVLLIPAVRFSGRRRR